MKRLFTFGCSFTNYNWPTWANILAQEADYFENWGRAGAGNHYIFYSLIESIKRNCISNIDSVAIMWTSVGREDRFIKGTWHTPGSVWHAGHTEEYLDQYADPTGYLLTNVTIIDAAKKLLDNIGCEYYFFKTVPFTEVDDSCLKLKFTLDPVEKEVAELYSATLESISPSVYKTVFNNDWDSRNNVYIKGIEQQELKNLRISYDNCAGPDWPNFEQFASGDFVEPGFEFLSNTRDKIQAKTRLDTHPIPLEHLEYLKQIGLQTTDRQQEYANMWNEKLLNDCDFFFENTHITRF